MKAGWLHVVLLASLGCGATVPNGPEAGVADASSPDVLDSGPVDDAGYSRCMSPSGYAICGGGCDPPTVCIDGCDAATPAKICENNALLKYWDIPYEGCVACNDGDLCRPLAYRAPLKGLGCMPFELGNLLYRADPDASGAIPVFYYDRAPFTGAPPPNPTICPSIPDVKVCGGNCGGCDTGQHCIGRSPLHPVGFCAAASINTMCGGGYGKCKSGLSCFTFTVPPDAQPVSDANGICLAPVTCQSLAANLPGGGTCTP